MYGVYTNSQGTDDKHMTLRTELGPVGRHLSLGLPHTNLTGLGSGVLVPNHGIPMCSVPSSPTGVVSPRAAPKTRDTDFFE